MNDEPSSERDKLPRGTLKVYLCLLYTSDAADDTASV